jgi:thiosulfate reductase cytochrome b subunit
MAERAYIVPAWLRLWHWTNALLMILLIASGFSLHFSDPDLPLIRFDIARVIHNVSGIALTVLYVAYAIWNGVSGNWRQYVPSARELVSGLNAQNAYVAVGIFRGEPPPTVPTPERKFNVLQQATYLLVMYGAMPLLILTGLAFFFPEWAPETLFGMDGLLPLATAHYVIGALLTLFLFGHIYMGTMGTTPWAGFRMMITGWHDEHGGATGAAAESDTQTTPPDEKRGNPTGPQPQR